MNKILYGIICGGVLLCAGVVRADPIIGLDTIGVDVQKLSTDEIMKQGEEIFSEMSIEYLMGMGDSGLGDGNNPNTDSAMAGVVQNMAQPALITETGKLTPEVLADSEKTVQVIQSQIQPPSDKKLLTMTTEQVAKNRQALQEVQKAAAKDATAVAFANVQVSAEQPERQQALQDEVSKSTDLRGDIQSYAKAVSTATGEVTRSVALSAKELGLKATMMLSSTKSNKEYQEDPS